MAQTREVLATYAKGAVASRVQMSARDRPSHKLFPRKDVRFTHMPKMLLMKRLARRAGKLLSLLKKSVFGSDFACRDYPLLCY